MTKTSVLVAVLVAVGSVARADNKPFDATPPDKGDGPLLAAEPLLLKAAKRWASEHEHKITIKRSFTMEKSWTMTTDDDDHITGRQVRSVVFTYDATNKQCWQLLVDLYQDKQGKRWSSPEIVFLQDVNPMVVTCKSVDRMPKKR